MRLQPVQYGFKAGELTPRLFGNTQDAVYKNGLSECLNMIPLAQGPVTSRDGSLFLSEAGNDDDIRLIPFNVSRGKDFVVELGPLYLRIHDENGLVDIGGQQLVTDADFLRELLFWNDLTGDGTITFDHDTASVILTNGNGANKAAIGQPLKDVPAGDISTLHTLTGQFSGTDELTIEVGTTSGADDVFSATVTTPGSFSFSVTPAQATNFISFRNSGAANIDATVRAPGFRRAATTQELVTSYEAQDLAEIQYEMISSAQTLILAHSNHPTAQLVLTPPTDFQFSDITFVVPPTEWAGANHPGVVTVFQGRLWLARTPAALQTFWASQSGDYFNFDKASSDPDDGLEFSLAAPGEIEWMRGQKDLLMGTDLGEHRITAEGSIITPSNIDIRQQSAYGSANLLQAQNIGDQVLYVSPDHKKVRALTFDFFQQGWFSPDLTWIAEHIAKVGIKEMHFARDPNTQILCVLNDGDMAVCTYDRSQESLGWAHYAFSSGEVKSVAVVNGLLGSAIIAAVKQTNGKMILTIDPGSTTIRPNMDSALLKPVEPGNVVTGLEHLEGLEVAVKVSGSVYPNETVVGGQITIQSPVNVGSVGIATVGLGFTARIATLPLDVGSRTGTGLGMLKQWAKIYVRLIDSYTPKVNGIRPPTRSPSTPMNSPEISRTEDVQATDLGQSRLATVTVEQDLPLRLTVLNLFGIEGQYQT